MTYERILGDLKKKVYSPIYFLYGDEPYYIDLLSDYIEKNVLSEGEKEFNLTVVYGKEADVLTLIATAKRYPMMSNYQVVIVKEAQDVKDLMGKDKKNQETRSKKQEEDRNPLFEYVQHPQKSTLLVFCYKYKSPDGRTKIYKEMEKHGAVFESKKLYDNKVPDWIVNYVQSGGHRINPKAAMLVSEYLGSDLSKIANEIDKLILNLKAGDEIDADLVEKHIGISKDFNVFELQKALARRDIYKANQIANYFSKNQKNNPMVLTIPNLYNYFLKILTYHKLPMRGKNEVAGALGVNPYFVTEYEQAAKVYPEQKVINVISNIREYDLRLKGVNNGSSTEGELLKELVYKILH